MSKDLEEKPKDPFEAYAEMVKKRDKKLAEGPKTD
jgi:hypothetical protein